MFFFHRRSTTDGRQLAALHRRDQVAMRRVVAGRKGDRAVLRVRLERQARRALPFDEPVRAGADRTAHHVVARGLDDFARNRERVQHGELLEQRVIDPGQPKPQRVAIDRPQPFDRCVVVEAGARLARCVDDLARAGDQVGQ
jgi:hypothetical protein